MVAGRQDGGLFWSKDYLLWIANRSHMEDIKGFGMDISKSNGYHRSPTRTPFYCCKE